jgi:hypothetical protein
VVLGGETVNDEEAAADDLAGAITLIDIGTIPAATDINAYHLLANGDQLISFDTTINLPGGLTAEPGDVVRYDDSTYNLEFDASANGIPSGVVTDAISVDTNGDLLLSFDTTVALPGNLTVGDEDLVAFDGTAFSLFFDGSGAGIAPSLDLDGAHYLGDDKLLLSLDGSGTVDSVSFDDEDVLEYNLTGGTWELAYDGSAQHANWPAADLNAVYAIVDTITPGYNTIDFEDFGPNDQGKRFGVHLDEKFEGLDWAYPTSSKINTWGSFTVQDATAPGGNDSEGDSIPGAGGSENWVKVRASSVGKGAKITRCPGECFEFKAMKLFTQDHPAFINEVTVTWRTCDATTTDSTDVMLTDDMWVEVTAADLGIPEGTLLRAMWFNGVPRNPNAAKFGLDDLEVSIGPEPPP